MTDILAYVDGYNLYYGLRSAGLLHYMWLDICGVIASFLGKNENLIGINYYTSHVRGDREKLKRQQTFIRAIESHCGSQTILGSYSRRTRLCRTCGERWRTYIEKKTDTGIVTDLIADACAGKFDTAVLICADSDMVPAVERLKADFSSKTVRLLIPPGRRCKTLKATCHTSAKIRQKHLQANQLPWQFTDNQGRLIEIPELWKAPVMRPKSDHPVPLALRRPLIKAMRRLLKALDAGWVH